jgi:hypothetical protein
MPPLVRRRTLRKFRPEGVVSKRLNAPYRSASWLKKPEGGGDACVRGRAERRSDAHQTMHYRLGRRGMALALSQAQAMDRDNVFDAFIAQAE